MCTVLPDRFLEGRAMRQLTFTRAEKEIVTIRPKAEQLQSLACLGCCDRRYSDEGKDHQY